MPNLTESVGDLERRVARQKAVYAVQGARDRYLSELGQRIDKADKAVRKYAGDRDSTAYQEACLAQHALLTAERHARHLADDIIEAIKEGA